MRLLLRLILSNILILSACRTTDFNANTNRGAALPPLQSKDFVQETRESKQFEIKQGVTGANGNKNYTVTATGVVDIVVVVDNSGSMSEEQANLASRMAPLISSIQNSDWRIVVTTTDPADNCGYGPIKKGDANADSRFKGYVNAGIDGSGTERPIRRAVDALKADCIFGPGHWVRPNSTIAVVILTDEDNCHIDLENGYGCNGLPDKSGSYLTDYLSSIRKIGTEARVYGIFWHPSQSQGQCSTAMKQANIIADVVQTTGGTWGSICDSDFSSTLTRISGDVAKILKADFVLDSVPDAGSFQMTVNGQVWSQYSLNSANVHFTANPPAGAKIQVNYTNGAAGIVATSFDFPEQPADGVVTGTIGSASAGPITYDANSKKVTFAQKPADGSAIQLTYKVNTPLKTIFEIASGQNPTYLKVTVNGVVVEASKYTYDSKTGAVQFKDPPAESAKIHVEWRGIAKAS